MKYKDYVKKTQENMNFYEDFEPKLSDVKKLSDLTGKSLDDCKKALFITGDVMDDALEYLKGKKKEKKKFNVGDIVVRTTNDKGKLTEDCMEFLRTYKWFKILHVNENFNIDIGYVTPEGKTFMFFPNKFELRDKPIEPKIDKKPIIESFSPFLQQEQVKKPEATKNEVELNDYIYCLNNFRNTWNVIQKVAKVIDITKKPEFTLELEFDGVVGQFIGNRNIETKKLKIKENELKKILVIKPEDVEKFKKGLMAQLEFSKGFQKIMKKIKFNIVTKYADVSYIDMDIDDPNNITCLPVMKYKNSWEVRNKPYDNNQRQKIRIGRFLKKLNPRLSDKEIEKFIFEYKAMWNIIVKDADKRIKVVTGEEIRHWYYGKNYESGYDGGTLNNSCMRYKKSQKRFDIYCDNPDKIALAIYTNEDGKLMSRALIWKLNKPKNKVYMDRIYFNDMASKNILMKYAEDKKMLMYDKNDNGREELVVKLNKDYGKPENNPYMDTFQYFLIKNKKLINDLDWDDDIDYHEYVDND